MQPLFERTYKAGADLSLKQWHVAAHGSAHDEAILGTNLTVPAGIITDAPVANQPTKICERGVCHAMSGAAVTRLSSVACDATGRVVDATAADAWIVGVALEGCSGAGVLIEVWVQPAPTTADTEIVSELAAAVGDAADLETEATDVVGAVNEVKTTADAAYVLPETGIPATDLAAIAETVTISAANGQGTLALAGFGLLYHVQATIISGPAGAFVKLTKGENSLQLDVVDDAAQAIDCSSTNAVVDVLALNLPEE